MPSLRSKILRTYGFSKLVMLGFAVIVFVDLHYLNRQIEAGQAVTDFREATLEMRRDEKNLFLYRDHDSHAQLLTQIGVTRQALAENRGTFSAIGGEAMLRRIGDLLERYRDALERYPRLGPSEQAAARAVIRDLGHELSTLSASLSRGERKHLAEATQRAALSLMLAFAGVVVLGLAGGLFLVRRVVRPLRELEAGLHAIDEGRARTLPTSARDQEIQSFVTAFNAMLKHMRQQQDQAVGSDQGGGRRQVHARPHSQRRCRQRPRPPRPRPTARKD